MRISLNELRKEKKLTLLYNGNAFTIAIDNDILDLVFESEGNFSQKYAKEKQPTEPWETTNVFDVETVDLKSTCDKQIEKELGDRFKEIMKKADDVDVKEATKTSKTFIKPSIACSDELFERAKFIEAVEKFNEIISRIENKKEIEKEENILKEANKLKGENEEELKRCELCEGVSELADKYALVVYKMNLVNNNIKKLEEKQDQIIRSGESNKIPELIAKIREEVSMADKYAKEAKGILEKLVSQDVYSQTYLGKLSKNFEENNESDE